MTLKTLILAVAMLLSGTAVSLAQSLPNYGPNAPASGDSFGKPYSGAKPLGRHGWWYNSYYAEKRRAQRYHRRWYSRHYYE